jgi:hypothetical protein
MFYLNNSIGCAIAAAFLFVESHNRDKAKTTLSEHEALRFGQLSLDAQRQRYKHYDSCRDCSAMETAA